VFRNKKPESAFAVRNKGVGITRILSYHALLSREVGSIPPLGDKAAPMAGLLAPLPFIYAARS
jgi:hypothetical protein